MKLLTLNCHSWQESNQLKKIKILAKNIKEMHYDVIALQEVSQLKDSKILYDNIKEDNYVEILIQELNKLGVNDYSFIWDFTHIGYDIYEEGVAILTRQPIKDYHSFYVSKDNSIYNHKSRKIIKATININNEDYDFYNCHLGWWNDKEEPFKYQADKLIESLSSKKTTFFMGDFNNDAFVKGEGYDYLISKGLLDTYDLSIEKDSGVTVSGKIDGWDNCSEDKRIDLILCTNKVEVLRSKILFNTKENLVSDHFGVEVVIMNKDGQNN